jgi:hypothetical protein
MGAQDFADGGANGLDRSRGGLSQQMLELGEDPFDRVQVGSFDCKERAEDLQFDQLDVDRFSKVWS